MPDIRAIADAHLGHPKVACDIRGFDSTDHWRDTLLRNILRVARRDTIWYWLGDNFMGDWRREMEIVARIPGEHHWVLGNHDRPHPLHRNGHRYQRDAMRYYWSVQTVATLRHDGLTLLLSHFPYNGDTVGRPYDRYAQWRPRDEGLVLIHGHTHSHDRVSLSDRGTLQLHAGLDAWGYRPPTLHDLLAAGALAQGDTPPPAPVADHHRRNGHSNRREVVTSQEAAMGAS